MEIFCIAQTRTNDSAVTKWLEHLGVDSPEPKANEDPAHLCSLCGKRCYMSFEPGLNPNVNKVRKDVHKHVTNMLKAGHGSVLEHATWTFAIEGISRVCTAELNRHRAGVAVSEGSQRYIRFGDSIPYWEPESLKKGNRTLETKEDLKDRELFERRKMLTSNLIHQEFKHQKETYDKLCELWEIDERGFHSKKLLTSMFRRIVGQGASTGGVWTFNARALRHIAALRTSPGAEEEIAILLGKIMRHLVEDSPTIFGDFTEDGGVWTPSWSKV